MPVAFYPHDEDVQTGSLQDRLEILMEAAERYKSVVLETATAPITAPVETAPVHGQESDEKKRLTPRDLKMAFNWQEVARILREIRELPEATTPNKASKADRLTRLAEIYEVLRGAKMPKLEAVRAALMSEVTQLRR